MNDVFAIVLFLLLAVGYWLFGGVLFALVALLRLKRIRKLRFSCLFSLASAGCAAGAAMTGLSWAQKDLSACTIKAGSFTRALASQAVCGWEGIVLAAAAWGAILLVLGVVFMALSRSGDPSWIEQIDEALAPLDEEPPAPIVTSEMTSPDPIVGPPQV